MWAQRERQLAQLRTWERSMNSMCADSVPLAVENTADLQLPPQDFIYINENKVTVMGCSRVAVLFFLTCVKDLCKSKLKWKHMLLFLTIRRHKPPHPHPQAGASVEIPKEPVVGCECEDCGNSKACCSHMMGSAPAYNKQGKLKVSVGTPIYECNSLCR